jgi:hypothetical protein
MENPFDKNRSELNKNTSFNKIGDFQKRFQILGRTNQGRSVVIENWIRNSMTSSRGFLLIDPHSEFYSMFEDDFSGEEA